jgi:tetratricopeptide (TPR) repeat protein
MLTKRSHAFTPFLLLAAVLVGGSAPLTAAASAADAKALLDAGKVEEAIAAYRSVTEAKPEDGRAWMGLGHALIKAGRFADARDAYARARVAGVGPAALFHTARAYAAEGNADAAMEALSEMVAAGAKPYAAVQGTEEFSLLADRADFRALMETLKPCNTPEYRQFDFWLGRWDVASTAGSTGDSHITSTYGGCVVEERYESGGGSFAGTSLSFYDSKDGKWHQTWIDNQGQALYLAGGLEGESMVLGSDAENPPIQRVTWTPLGGGKVRQLWESSSDGGESWSLVFDGTYTPKGE